MRYMIEWDCERLYEYRIGTEWEVTQCETCVTLVNFTQCESCVEKDKVIQRESCMAKKRGLHSVKLV